MQPATICVRSGRRRRAAISEPNVQPSAAVTSGIEAQNTDQPTPDCRSSGTNASMPRNVKPFASAIAQTARPEGVRGTTGSIARHSLTTNAIAGRDREQRPRQQREHGQPEQRGPDERERRVCARPAAGGPRSPR